VSLVETQTIFERGVSGADVEEWVLNCLQRWSGTYLSEVERQHGVAAGTLARVRYWEVAASFDKWPEDQLPGVTVISPGLVPPPTKDGSSAYRARWQIRIGCICSARTQRETHVLASWYVLAHRWLMLQRQSLDGKAEGVQWIDENYAAPPFVYDDTRTLYSGYSTFAVSVADVTTVGAGPTLPDAPLDPDTTPWPLWRDVETTDVDVEHTPPPDPIPPYEGGS